MDYRVKVDNFEGPMDLLLFFIQRDSLNVYDIPIAHIGTSQIFLESLGLDKIGDLPKLKELSELMIGSNPDPVLFENDYASK